METGERFWLASVPVELEVTWNSGVEANSIMNESGLECFTVGKDAEGLIHMKPSDCLAEHNFLCQYPEENQYEQDAESVVFQVDQLGDTILELVTAPLVLVRKLGKKEVSEAQLGRIRSLIAGVGPAPSSDIPKLTWLVNLALKVVGLMLHLNFNFDEYAAKVMNQMTPYMHVHPGIEGSEERGQAEQQHLQRREDTVTVTQEVTIEAPAMVRTVTVGPETLIVTTPVTTTVTPDTVTADPSTVTMPAITRMMTVTQVVSPVTVKSEPEQEATTVEPEDQKNKVTNPMVDPRMRGNHINPTPRVHIESGTPLDNVFEFSTEGRDEPGTEHLGSGPGKTEMDETQHNGEESLSGSGNGIQEYQTEEVKDPVKQFGWSAELDAATCTKVEAVNIICLLSYSKETLKKVVSTIRWMHKVIGKDVTGALIVSSVVFSITCSVLVCIAAVCGVVMLCARWCRNSASAKSETRCCGCCPRKKNFGKVDSGRKDRRRLSDGEWVAGAQESETNEIQSFIETETSFAKTGAKPKRRIIEMSIVEAGTGKKKKKSKTVQPKPKT